jgi:hypothetical protein
MTLRDHLPHSGAAPPPPRNIGLRESITPEEAKTMADLRGVHSAQFTPVVDENMLKPAGPETDRRVQETTEGIAHPEDVTQEVAQSRGAGDPLNKSVALLNFRGGPAGSSGATALSAPAAKPADMKKKMDDYFARSNNEYTMPDGSKVRTQPHFQMNVKYNTGDTSKRFEDKLNQVLQPKDPSFKRAIHMVVYGRGTPEQIQQVTQALIHKGGVAAVKKVWEEKGEAEFKAKYPNTSWPLTDADAVKLMQWSMGVGVDCAGYAQQEFLSVHGGSRADYGFQGIGDESLTGLKGNRHFRQVGPGAAEPGDLMILAAPPGEVAGHAVMVQDRHALTDGVRANYPGIDDFAKPADKVQVMVVEGSFGAGGQGDPARGGVQRRTFLYNETTKQWADVRHDWTRTSEPTVHISTSNGPYNHPLDGIYHPTGK